MSGCHTLCLVVSGEVRSFQVGSGFVTIGQDILGFDM
jgi:hypothetical protein